MHSVSIRVVYLRYNTNTSFGSYSAEAQSVECFCFQLRYREGNDAITEEIGLSMRDMIIRMLFDKLFYAHENEIMKM